MSSGGKRATKAYRAKRRFRRTPEPSGKRSGRRRAGRIFVIQKHAARQLHYDFRIEVDGVLKSWAVPKGPSLDPRQRRLARQVEDHPLDYKDFEGVIPEGEYGAGTVMVWERGTYQHTTEIDDRKVSIARALARGHLTLRLRGRKLKGGFALTRTGRGRSKRWLLVKMKDDHADARRNPVSTEPKSVLTGRTIRQISNEEGGDDS